MGRRHSLEIIFEKQAKAAGFIVKDAKTIRIDEPVKNHNGRKDKVVTHPDFFVTDPETNQSVHVEIGNGKNDNNNGHKAAQMRVAKKAGVENYVQLNGHQIKELKKAKTVEELKKMLIQMLYLLLFF
jgi:N-acetylmuramoyl-L-alanine amidase